MPGHTFDEDFFDANATQERYSCIKGITWEKLTLQNNLLSKNNVNEILKCNLDQRKYEMLKNGWKRIAKKLRKFWKKRRQHLQLYKQACKRVQKGTQKF